MPAPRPEFPLLLVPVMLAWFAFVIYALSRLAGWHLLAAAYPGRPHPAPRATWMGYAVLNGWVGYNGALIVGADEHGLDVAAWPLFSWCHPPVFIPWSEVRAVRSSRFLWARLRNIELAGAPGVRFALRETTFRLIEARLRAAGVTVDG